MNGTTNIMGKPEAQAVVETVERLTKPELLELAPGVKVLVRPGPNGGATSIKSLIAEYDSAPERRKGEAQLGSLQSFIDHTNRFKDDDSVIFASEDPSEPKLTAVLDYHRAGAIGDPRFGEHRGVYEFPLSDEWKAWTESDGVAHKMSQATFAEFIESNVQDVAPPEAAGKGALEFAKPLGVEFASVSRLVELSRGLTIRENSKVTQAVNIGSGEVQLAFSSQHQDESGQPLKIPGAFLLNLRVFRGGDVFQVPARLRYRAKDGQVVFWYDLWRTDKVFEVAFGEACAKAAHETKLPLLVGTPEG